MDALKALMTALKTLMVANTYTDHLAVSVEDSEYLRRLVDMSWVALFAYYDMDPNKPPFGDELVDTIFAFHKLVNATKVEYTINLLDTMSVAIYEDSSYYTDVLRYNTLSEEDPPSVDYVGKPSIFSAEMTSAFDRMCEIFVEQEQ